MEEKKESLKGKNLEDLKKDLLEILEVETQKELAVELGTSEATITRLFSDVKGDYKRGPQPNIINSIVSVLMKKQEYAENKGETINLVCKLFCPDPEEYINKYNLMPKVQINTEIIKDDRLVNATDPNQSTNKNKLQALNRLSSNMKSLIYEKSKEIIGEIGYEITNEEWVSDSKDLFRVKWEGKIPYRDKRIEWIYGIELIEDNYTNTIHEILSLEERDGLIILYCEQLTLDRALRDKILKVKNNVLLCNAFEESKLYVKSVRKGEKGFLRFHFGTEKLIFPRK